MAAVVVDEGPGPVPVTACRGLHLVDLENLLADPWARGPAVGRALDQYLERADFRPGDLVFVAGNPWLMVELGWSHGVDCHRFAARGPQGADRKLLEASPLGWVARRFDRLAVGSGDGVFADRIAQARASGLAVHLVSRPDSLSWRLASLAVPTTWFVGRQPARRRTSSKRSIEASTSR
jgi:hypothetical protein